MSCINSETCWSRLHSNTMCKTLSQSGRVVHSLLLGSGVCTGAFPWGTFITGWVIHCGSDLKQVLELGAWSCYMLSGLLCLFYGAHPLAVNATICKGPWACVVCSVRCFACWESGGLLWDHGRRSIKSPGLSLNCWLLSFNISILLCLLLLPYLWIHSLHLSFLCLSVCLAVGGVRQGHLAAKHLPVQWWETVGGLWVDQTEKLQFINVEVTDRLHCGQLGYHLWGQRRYYGKFPCCAHNYMC